ncbi:hypothetical protein JSY36_04590 [Bacillus sp. H-16]|uniref:hypothetical protein n=1 Tax=Alteribacter salitolerans TaxID=2912333 RepID=UPI0019658145|nr:hypothetical protein [Alteribacter salitolerans]MBM7095029.1 hypothetical protein [Alteribacter salitolerans]
MSHTPQEGKQNRFDYLFQVGLVLAIIPAGYPGGWPYMLSMGVAGLSVLLFIYRIFAKQSSVTDDMRKTVNRLRKYSVLGLWVSPAFLVTMQVVQGGPLVDRVVYLAVIAAGLFVIVYLFQRKYEALLKEQGVAKEKDQPKGSDAVAIVFYIVLLVIFILIVQLF